MSGIPGSGKTTWINDYARRTKSKQVVCSADDYHVRFGNGAYRFEAKNIQAAHNECLSNYLAAVADRSSCRMDEVFVDNTSLTAWEISPYYRLAELYGAEVEIIRVWCDPLVAALRNVHDVPTDRVFAMYQKMLREVFPSHWKTRTVLPEGW